MPATPQLIRRARRATRSPSKPVRQAGQLTGSPLKPSCKKNPTTSKWTKMTSILDKMRDFKWGIKELVHAYLMEPLEEVGKTSVKVHRERFVKALLEEEE